MHTEIDSAKALLDSFSESWKGVTPKLDPAPGDNDWALIVAWCKNNGYQFVVPVKGVAYLRKKATPASV